MQYHERDQGLNCLMSSRLCSVEGIKCTNLSPSLFEEHCCCWVSVMEIICPSLLHKTTACFETSFLFLPFCIFVSTKLPNTTFFFFFCMHAWNAKNWHQSKNRCLVLSSQTCEQRHVSHFQYLSWPDYGVPTSAVTLIDFLGAVKRQQKKMVKTLGSQWTGHPLGPPMVVHCSAGIGRTGEIMKTFGIIIFKCKRKCI